MKAQLYAAPTIEPISLAELKRRAAMLEDFALLRRGNRLSVLPVSAAQWAFILALENATPD